MYWGVIDSLHIIYQPTERIYVLGCDRWFTYNISTPQKGYMYWGVIYDLHIIYLPHRKDTCTRV